MRGELRKGGIVFEILIFVRQNQPLRALAVGEMKAALRIDQDVFFFQNIEFFVGKTIPERADFRGIFKHARTFDIEEQIFHKS